MRVIYTFFHKIFHREIMITKDEPKGSQLLKWLHFAHHVVNSDRPRVRTSGFLILGLSSGGTGLKGTDR